MLFASAPMSLDVPSSLGLPPWSGRAGGFGSWSSGEQLPYSDEPTRTKVSITCSLATLASVSRWALKAQMRKASAPPARRRSRSAAGQCMAVCGLLGPSGGIQVGPGCGPSCLVLVSEKHGVKGRTKQYSSCCPAPPSQSCHCRRLPAFLPVDTFWHWHVWLDLILLIVVK